MQGSPAAAARLAEVRELLGRRQALHRSLSERLTGLGGEIEALRQRRDQAWTRLRHERDEAAALERRLDQLVPRYLARAAAVEARRERAAQALADLASLSRKTELDSTVRARLLAISPLMLDRLRHAEQGLAAQRPDALIRRHHEIEARGPALLAERQNLEATRDRRQRQQRVAAARLERLAAEVVRLGQEQAGLARRMLQAESAHLARAEPGAAEPALPDDGLVARRGSRIGAAMVRGTMAGPPSLAIGAGASQPAASQVVAGVPTPGAELVRPQLAVQAELPAMPPPPAKPANVVIKGDLGMPSPAASRDATQGARSFEVAFVDSIPSARAVAPPAPRAVGLRTPIKPIPGRVATSRRDGDSSGLTFLGEAGQSVAAPEAGRVVFAQDFLSYGPLLIIEHAPDYHTLLWGFARLDVEAEDRVRAGQIVGVVGASDAQAAELHMEIRRNGRPVNPSRWLAASNSKVRS